MPPRARLNIAGGKAIAVKGDVAKAADMRRLFDETEKAFGTTSNELQSTRSKTDLLRILT